MHTFSEERQKLKVLADNSPDFMGISNNDNIIEYLNKSAYRLLGIDEGTDLKTLTSADFYPSQKADLMRDIYNTLVEKGSWQGNVWLKHFKTGELIPGYGNYETVIDPPTGLWMSDTQGGLTYLNKTLVDWTGMPYDALLGAGWANAIVEEDRQRSGEAFLAAVNSRTHYDVEFRIRKFDNSVIWCRAAGDPFYNDEGDYAGYAGFCMDIHQRVEMANTIQANEDRIKSIVDQAPVAISVLKGKDFAVESANQRILKIWGKDASVIGLPLNDALPEIKGQGFIELLENVYNTGVPYYGNSTLVKLEQDGKLEDVFVDFVYAPVRESGNKIDGVLVVATDVTPLALAKKQAEEAELFSRTVLFNSPVAKLVLVDADMKIRSINEKMLDLTGKDNSIVGKIFVEAFPELASTPLKEYMDHVYRTGETFDQPETKIEFNRYGQAYTGYYHYIYKALRSVDNEIYGIIVTAMEITDQVQARRKIEEAQSSAQGAIDLANLGTWSIDLKARTLDYDTRLRNWYGFSEDEIITPERSGEPCDKEDLDRVREEMIRAITPGSSGVYDVEYSVKNIRTGLKRILHARGKTFWDKNGGAYKISGSVRDITQERKVELELTQQIQMRTEELAATNEELAASNEELQAVNEEMTSVNEEMEESNKHLFQTNEELSQYAYVASHDLQEPLRKIQVYTGMLMKQKELAEESRPYVEKINKSSGRMTQLIRDLLEFSKLGKNDLMLNQVNLNEAVREVITDFELIITEKKAVIDIGTLPIVKAVGLQMNQLFYNLISNSLKFTDPARSPHISVASRILSIEEARSRLERHNINGLFCDITMSDNGIGFDIKFADQIFEVFKRLHSKDIYPGSGIGLALCRRIVNNHGGSLTVESKVGLGTTFHIILPVMNQQI